MENHLKIKGRRDPHFIALKQLTAPKPPLASWRHEIAVYGGPVPGKKMQLSLSLKFESKHP